MQLRPASYYVLKLQIKMWESTIFLANGEQRESKMEDTDQKLRQAIKEGDHENLERLLIRIPRAEKDAILNPSPAKDRLIRRYRNRSRNGNRLLGTSPILFDSLFSDKIIFDILLKNGANIFITDQQGWNIIHYLVVVSYNIQDLEQEAVNVYNRLKDDTQIESVKALLFMEDSDGLRPLEFAIHLGCLGMFEAIFETQDVYLVKKERKGFYDFIEYDISEYEGVGCDIRNRRHKSPMLLLAVIDKRVLKNKKAVEILSRGPLADWVGAKVNINFLFVFTWAIIRLLVVVCFYFVISVNVPWKDLIDMIIDFIKTSGDLDETLSNVTESVENQTCEVIDWYGGISRPKVLYGAILYMLVYSICAVVYDVFEGFVSIFYNWAKWRAAFGKSKDLVASTSFYRICQLFFSILSIIWTIFYMIEPKSIFTAIGLILTIFFSIWSALYFVQIAPFIGKFVNSIQQMLKIMIQFVVVYAIILIPFPHGFQVLLRGENKCDTIEGFENLGMGSYSAFRMMLNMIDLTSYKVEVVSLVYVMHAIFVFFVAVLLMNFLIALMSSSVGEIVEAGDAILMIQRLSVVMLIEWRLTRPFSWLYVMLHRMFFNVAKRQIHLKHRRIFRGVFSKKTIEQK